MIRGIFQNGAIQPVGPVPDDWTDGQELLIETVEGTPSPQEIQADYALLQRLAADIPPEDHQRIAEAIDEQGREGKEHIRREMGLI